MGRLESVAADLNAARTSLAGRRERAGSWLIDRVIDHAPRGTRGGALLDRALRMPLYGLAALLLYTWFAQETVRAVNAKGHPEGILALLVVPLGLFLLRRPVPLGLLIAAGGAWLRLAYLSIPESCDQMAVSRAALTTALGGSSPWGFGYAESVPPGAPYPYGPLAMATSILGVPGEVLAVTGILVILACTRSLLSVTLLASWIHAVELGTCGLNDQVPALLVTAGLLLLEQRRPAMASTGTGPTGTGPTGTIATGAARPDTPATRHPRPWSTPVGPPLTAATLAGAALLAASAAIKPYGFAWLPGIMGYGGPWLALAFGAVAGLLWSPALAWGIGAYASSIEMARDIHPKPENTLNMPELRILALPIGLAALLVRSWSGMVLSGVAIFMVVLFLDKWASVGYWFVVLPILGIMLERGLRGFGARFALAVRDRDAAGTGRVLGAGEPTDELLGTGTA